MNVFAVALTCCLSVLSCKPPLASGALQDFTPSNVKLQSQDDAAAEHSRSSKIRSGDVSEVQASTGGTPHPATGTPHPATERPAEVHLKGGLLTVAADNSDLTQILAAIANVSGMVIDGSVGDVRVFGTYGPGNSRDVLTKLLRGLGYNFIMVGATPEGTPRTLQLTLQRASAPPSSGPAVSTQTPPRETHAEDQEQPGPGAILHVPPAPPEDTQDRMRQTLQRLQQMHDQQKPQNTPQ